MQIALKHNESYSELIRNSTLELVKEDENVDKDIQNFAKERGRKICCKHCEHKFKFSNRTEKSTWLTDGGICPACKIDMCYLPPSERTLKILQDQFLATGDNAIMEEMYKILKPYAGTLIRKKYPLHYNSKESQDELDYHSHCTAWYLIEHYYKGKNFKITDSFGSYLRFTMMQTVFDRYHSFAPVSLNYEDPESKKVYELPSNKDFIKDIEEKKHSINLIDYISNLLFDIGNYSNSIAEDFNRLVALKIFLQKGEKSVDRFFQLTDRIGKGLYEDSLGILKDELYKLSKTAVKN